MTKGQISFYGLQVIIYSRISFEQNISSVYRYNHYEAAFNSLNYVPPRKPRLPVMILHRQISDI